MAHDCCGLSFMTGTTGTWLVTLPSTAVDRGTNGYSPKGQCFALSLQYGRGRVVVVGNSGIAGDFGTPMPAPGMITVGSNLTFLVSALSWLAQPSAAV